MEGRRARGADLQRVLAVRPVEVDSQGSASPAGSAGCSDLNPLAVQPASKQASCQHDVGRSCVNYQLGQKHLEKPL